jgi:tetratricopeptide (TPR) repeat protein
LVPIGHDRRPARAARAPALIAGVFLPFALIYLVTLAAYAPVLSAGFVWNDSDYVTQPGLRSVQGLKRIWCEVGATEQYYPVLHTAFWVEHRLWGDAPAGYHLLNVLLHATAAGLLGLVLRRLLRPSFAFTPGIRLRPGAEGQERRPRVGVEWLAALLFALHPVFVESVAWISEQKNTLSTVFYLLAALAYLRFDQKRDWPSYLGASACFVLALLSKSVTATLPVALLMLLWWRRGRLSWTRDIAPLLPWFALGATVGLFTAWVERVYVGAHGAAYELSPIQRCLLAGRAVWFYLGKLVWPGQLVFIYPRWSIRTGDPLGWIALVAAGVATALLWRRTRAGLLAWAFFCLSLFPVLGFFNVYAFRYSFVADHWQYLPAIGIIVAAAVLFAERRSAALVLAAFFGVLTWQQTRMYHDAERLYRATLERNPGCWMASQNLGSLLLESGRVPEAVAQFEATLRIEPRLADAENNLAVALEGLGRRDEAIAHLRRALQLKPDYAQADYNLGQMLLDLNRPAEALAPLEAAARLKPGVAEIQDQLGVCLGCLGRPKDAAACFEQAAHLAPDDPQTLDHLGYALTQLGRTQEALPRLEQALRLNPDSPEIHNHLGLALATAERWDEAIAQFERAIRLNPNYADAHFRLALVLWRVGRRTEAIAQREEALRLNPSLPR